MHQRDVAYGDFRFWHKADIRFAPMSVRFWG
jgi:hypothetical protein